jgi:hypothetical protein
VWVNKNAGTRPKKQWPKYTIDVMMDNQCCFHTFQPDKPENHLTMNCSWFDDIVAGRAGPVGLARPAALAAPSLLTSANTIAVQPQKNNAGN